MIDDLLGTLAACLLPAIRDSGGEGGGREVTHSH